MTEVRKSGRAGFGFLALMLYVGAAIYFISHSDGSFWGVVLGLLQAIIWPVYLVFHVLQALHV
jgi:hypothetical protein